MVNNQFKICKHCCYCKTVNNIYGICTEEHGPRNARGELGKQVQLSGACQHYQSKKAAIDKQYAQMKKEKRRAEEELKDVLPE